MVHVQVKVYYNNALLVTLDGAAHGSSDFQVVRPRRRGAH
jgi:hypothetical protein